MQTEKKDFFDTVESKAIFLDRRNNGACWQCFYTETWIPDTSSLQEKARPRRDATMDVRDSLHLLSSQAHRSG